MSLKIIIIIINSFASLLQRTSAITHPISLLSSLLSKKRHKAKLLELFFLDIVVCSCCSCCYCVDRRQIKTRMPPSERPMDIATIANIKTTLVLVYVYVSMEMPRIRMRMLKMRILLCASDADAELNVFFWLSFGKCNCKTTQISTRLRVKTHQMTHD